MDLQLNDKRALITGSTSGIGEGIAKTLAAEGASVVINGRNETEAARVVKEITDAGGKAAVALGDLGERRRGGEPSPTRRWRRSAGSTSSSTTPAIFPMKPWLDTTAADWNDVFNVNVTGPVRLITRLAPAMKERGWGRFIALGSFLGPMPEAFIAPYGVTKMANIAQAVSLAKALAGTGVTSNTVSPGPIRTPGMEAGIREMAEAQGQPYDFDAFEKQYVEGAKMPVQHIGAPRDIANAVAFLCSPLADFITGANLRVDGGMMPTTN